MASAYLNRYPEPEDPRTGRRRPHVPSSKPTMSKSRRQKQADNNRSPFFNPGDCCPSMLATEEDAVVCGGVPVGGAAYMEGVGFGQPPFYENVAVLNNFFFNQNVDEINRPQLSLAAARYRYPRGFVRRCNTPIFYPKPLWRMNHQPSPRGIAETCRNPREWPYRRSPSQ
jgi:hypothetical protein